MAETLDRDSPGTIQPDIVCRVPGLQLREAIEDRKTTPPIRADSPALWILPP